jgi:hypothetical protein
MAEAKKPAEAKNPEAKKTRRCVYKPFSMECVILSENGDLATVRWSSYNKDKKIFKGNTSEVSLKDLVEIPEKKIVPKPPVKS